HARGAGEGPGLSQRPVSAPGGAGLSGTWFQAAPKAAPEGPQEDFASGWQ
ncbi:unnamed protein product, partial [Effrenium voratum]